VEGTIRALADPVEEMANRYTEYVVTQLNGNKRQATQAQDVSRATLYRRLKI